jgi:DNA-directed RNA polymerase II subunit RPB2
MSAKNDEISLEKVCWEIIDSYFYNVSHYISKNQIDSYNMFVDEQIGKTIRQFNPIQFVYSDSRALTYEVDIIVGGTRKENDEIVNDGAGIRIAKPIIHEKRVVKNSDGTEIIQTKNKQLYPNEARLKNLTYTLAVYCDIHIITRLVTEQGTLKTIVTTLNNKLLGKIPLMLHSKACVLSDIPQSNLKDFGECPYDQGGYFIIDGKEKVITAQTRQVENKIYTYKRKPDEPDEYHAEIRSTPEDYFQPARITNVYIKKPETNPNSRFKNKENLIFVGIPNIKEQVPITIIFRALGMTSDKEILQCMVGDLDSPLGVQLVNMLYDNILLGSDVRTQIEALRYLQNLIRPFDKTKKTHILELATPAEKERYINNLKDKEETEFKYIYDILYNYILPHIGTTNLIEKALFLGYMTNQLLKTKMGLIETTDRDNYMYKRIDISGFLVATIFRDLYFRVKNLMIYKTNQTYAAGQQRGIWSSETIGTLINDENIETIFDQSIMTDGFKYAFKNCWGLKNAPCKEGVVQDLARLTYLGMISHLRRVVTPLSSSSKMRGPHMLHLSTYGILCPIETPDGANVGVKTNIALMTDITFGTHSGAIYQALLDNHLIDLSMVTIEKVEKDSLTRIFLNGRLVGYHSRPNLLANRMRLLRRNALINIYTSIAWYIDRREIKISTDSGRSCHPMIIIKDNKLAIKQKHIDGILNGTIKWQELIGGIGKKWDQYDNKYYRTTKSDIELEATGGVIEFIDTEESNTLLIAMKQSDLTTNHNVTFTHCEIHPSIIFGIMGSIIPYVQTNQLPRNLYSCGQGKQAIGVYASNFRNRMDTKTQVLYYPQKPLVQNRVSKHLYNNILPYGINAVIAIACYTGYNQDDSIIFNRSSLNRGLFRSIKFRTYAIREELSDLTRLRSKICNPILISAPGSGIVIRDLKSGNYNKLDENGIVREGVKVDENDIVVGKVIITEEHDINGNQIYLDASEYVRRAETGIIDKVFYSYDNNDFLFVKVRLRKEKIPELGDKFAGRAGQKGIMGMMLHEQDMPVSRHGVRPDMIINPQAFPKRMTISQFIETQQTKQCSLLGVFGDSSPFQDIPLNKMGDVLESLGFERTGCEILYNGMTGEPLEHHIFIGPTYYERLQHQVEDKMHSRDIGAVTMLNKQPTGGRSIGGGLRIGEMERDAILSHGTAGFLKETMGDRADNAEFYVCNGCGFMGMVNPEKKIYHCYSCNSTKISYHSEKLHKEQIETSKNDFSQIQMPYAMKLLTQELESMSIGPRIVTKQSSLKWKTINKYSNQKEINTDIEMILAHETDGDKYYVTEGSNYDRDFRKYHNFIKSVLLDGARAITGQTRKPHIFDISVGRGGDLNKWISSNYGYVLGLDLSEGNISTAKDNFAQRIENARNRIENARFFSEGEIEYGISNMCLNIYNGDSYSHTNKLNQTKLKNIFNKRGKNSFDVVSVQFSIHYCFDNIVSVQNLLRNISDSLRDGGIAIITTLDGEKVHKEIASGKAQFYYNDSQSGKQELLYSIRKAYNDDSTDLSNDESSLGKKIFVKLGTTGQEIQEYLVSKPFLISQAKLFGLNVVKRSDFQNSFKFITNPVDSIGEQLGNLATYNTNAQALLNDPNLKDMVRFSRLFNYYVFIKETPVEIATNNLETCNSLIPKIKNIDSTKSDILYERYLLGKLQKRQGEFRSSLPISLKKSTSMLGPDYKPDMVFKTIDSIAIYTNNAVYCLIKNGNVSIFHPVKKTKYNQFSGQLIQSSILNNTLERYKYYPEKGNTIESNLKFWHKEGCVVKTEQFKWSDQYYRVVYHMLASLCKERRIPDTELIIKLDEFSTRNDSILYDFPILALQSNKQINDDVAIPTPFDWWCITKLYFSSKQGCRNGYFEIGAIEGILPKWQQRKNIMVFRGTSKTCGTDLNTNIRLATQDYFSKNTQYQNNVDFKITEYDTDILINKDAVSTSFTRGKRESGQEENLEYVSNINEEPLAELSAAKLAEYKYILYMDGRGASMKYAYLMTLGSVIIRIESKNKLWYDPLLIGQSIEQDFNEKADHILVGSVDRLGDVITWCLANDDKCAKIGKNAQQLAQSILNKDLVFDYLETVINNIHNRYSPEVAYTGQETLELYESVGSQTIEVSQILNDIIINNKQLLEGHFDISIEHKNPTIIKSDIWHNIYINGTKSNRDKFEEYIDSLSNFKIDSIDDVNEELISELSKIKSNVENHFNVYFEVLGNSVRVFGDVQNVALLREFLDNSQNRLPVIPWINMRQLSLKINVGDLFNDVVIEPIAVVLVTRDPLNEMGKKYLSSGYIKDIKDQLSRTFKKRNITFTITFVKQSTKTTMRNIPEQIIVKDRKDAPELFQNLKTNELAMLKFANRIIPSEFKNIFAIDIYNWDVYSFDSEFDRLLYRLDKQITLINNCCLFVKNRNLLEAIPDHLYGVSLTEYVNSVEISTIISNKFCSYEKIDIKADLATISDMEKLFIKNRKFPNYDFFSIKSSELVNGIELFEIDFNEKTHPMILTSDKYPKVDLKTNRTDWVIEYIKTYYPEIKYKISKNNIIISLDSKVDITAGLDVISCVRRLVPAIEFILSNILGVPTRCIMNETDTDLIVTVLSSEPIILEEEVNILPYYKIANKYYIRNITPDVIDKFSKTIGELKDKHPQTRGLIYPETKNIYITRIGDILFYYHSSDDIIVIYDLNISQFIDKIPSSMDILDLDLMLVLWKNNNNSSIKLVIGEPVATINQLNINRLSVPDLSKITPIQKSATKPIDKYTMTLLSMEPEIADLPEKYFGYVD